MKDGSRHLDRAITLDQISGVLFHPSEMNFREQDEDYYFWDAQLTSKLTVVEVQIEQKILSLKKF